VHSGQGLYSRHGGPTREAPQKRSYHHGVSQTWSVFSYSNLAPTSRTSDLNTDRARLVYGLIARMKMNIGGLISAQMTMMAQSNSSRLGFPALITACVDQGELDLMLLAPTKT